MSIELLAGVLVKQFTATENQGEKIRNLNREKKPSQLLKQAQRQDKKQQVLVLSSK